MRISLSDIEGSLWVMCRCEGYLTLENQFLKFQRLVYQFFSSSHFKVCKEFLLKKIFLSGHNFVTITSKWSPYLLDHNDNNPRQFTTNLCEHSAWDLHRKSTSGRNSAHSFTHCEVQLTHLSFFSSFSIITRTHWAICRHITILFN